MSATSQVILIDSLKIIEIVLNDSVDILLVCLNRVCYDVGCQGTIQLSRKKFIMSKNVMVYVYPVKRLIKRDNFVRARNCANKLRSGKYGMILNCVKSSRGIVISATFKN